MIISECKLPGHGMLELDSSHSKSQRCGSGSKRKQYEESASTSLNGHGYDSAEMHVASFRTQSHEAEGHRGIQTEERVATSGPAHDYSDPETVVANSLRNRRVGVSSTRMSLKGRAASKTCQGSPILTLKHSYVSDEVDHSNFETVVANNLKIERIGVSCTGMSPKEGYAIGDTSDDCSKSETVVANSLRSQRPGVASTRMSQKEGRVVGYSSSETVRSQRIGVASTRMSQKEAREVSETSHDYSKSETVRSRRIKVVSTRTIQNEGREASQNYCGGNNKTEMNNNLVRSILANSSDDEPMIVWRSRRRNG